MFFSNQLFPILCKIFYFPVHLLCFAWCLLFGEVIQVLNPLFGFLCLFFQILTSLYNFLFPYLYSLLIFSFDGLSYLIWISCLDKQKTAVCGYCGEQKNEAEVGNKDHWNHLNVCKGGSLLLYVVDYLWRIIFFYGFSWNSHLNNYLKTWIPRISR